LSATIALLGLNGRRLTWSNDQAYKLIIEVATGKLDEVASIADRIRRGSEARHR
jgi:death-on-curing protein